MKRRTQNIIRNAIIILIVASMVLLPVIEVFADNTKILTLGADLSEEQKQLMLNYFGVTEAEVYTITVTNEDEHRFLDGIATPQQIGKHTFSCTYIEPTNEGGLHIKTVNLNWVTSEMIRNSLITSGITNCNIIAAAPIEVSGTGALTGIFLAYEDVSGEKLDEEKMEIASEELITTADIANTVGQDKASSMLSELKEQVITEGKTSENDILALVEKYLKEHKIELTEEQKWKLVELLLKIMKQDYDIEEIKKAYSDIKETAEFVRDTSEKAKSVWEKICDWFKTTWAKLTGKYEELRASEEYNQLKDQLGILAGTNDNLLSDSTVVTVTEQEIQDVQEEQANQEDEETSENNEETKEKEDNAFIKFIKNLFNKEATEENKDENTENSEDGTSGSDETTEDTELNFETIQEATSETEESTSETEGTIEENDETLEDKVSEDGGMLDYITYDVQNEVEQNSSSGQSLDDILE